MTECGQKPKERYSHIICIFYWTNLLCTKLPYCLLYNRELFECPPVLSSPGNDSSKRLCQTQQVIIIIIFIITRHMWPNFKFSLWFTNMFKSMSIWKKNLHFFTNLFSFIPGIPFNVVTFFRFLKNYQEVSEGKQDSLPDRYTFY